MMFFAANIRSALARGACIVRFEKVNGEEREMVCTTKYELISAKASFTKFPYPNDECLESDLINVYDLQNCGWRSFYAAKVLSFEPVS